MKRMYEKEVLKFFLISRLLIIGIIIIFCIITKTSINDIYNYHDNEWYRLIAINGYNDKSVVFFPMIPLMIRYFSVVGCAIINIVASYFTGLLIYKLSNYKAMKLFFFSPVSVFCVLVYTESLFSLFTTLTYYLYNKKRYFASGVVLGLSVLTRNLGSMLFFSIFFVMFINFIKRKVKFIDVLKMYIPATLISLIYPIYLQVKFHSWRIFIDSQYMYWNRVRSNFVSIIISDIKFIFTDRNSFNTFYITTTFIFLLLMILFIIKDINDHKKLTVNSLYMILSILAIYSTKRVNYIPSTSFYRYFLGCFPMYLISGNLKQLSYYFVWILFLVFYVLFCLFFINHVFLC